MTKRILLLGVLLAGFGTMLVAPTAQASTTYHREHHGVYDGSCLTGTALKEITILGCGFSSGNMADFNQQWDWVPTDGYWRLKNRHHGTCLSISIVGISYVPDLQECNATHNRQQWNRTGNGEWKNRWTGHCLGWDGDDPYNEPGMYYCGQSLRITRWNDDVVATV